MNDLWWLLGGVAVYALARPLIAKARSAVRHAFRCRHVRIYAWSCDPDDFVIYRCRNCQAVTGTGYRPKPTPAPPPVRRTPPDRRQ